MPSIQLRSRKDRLSGTDLTLLARAKVRGSFVVYKYDPQGWYLHQPRQPAIFIGVNWVIACDYIAKIPSNNSFSKYLPGCIGGIL